MSIQLLWEYRGTIFVKCYPSNWRYSEPFSQKYENVQIFKYANRVYYQWGKNPSNMRKSKNLYLDSRMHLRIDCPEKSAEILKKEIQRVGAEIQSRVPEYTKKGIINKLWQNRLDKEKAYLKELKDTLNSFWFNSLDFIEKE